MAENSAGLRGGFCVRTFDMLFFNFISHPKNSLDVGGVLWVRLQLVPQAPDRVVHRVGA